MGTPKKLIVTGATGFLGGHLVHRLLAEGHTVGAIVRPTSRVEKVRAIRNLHIFNAADTASSFTSLGPIDAVIHTATCYGRNNEPVSDILAANVNFPLAILEQATAAGVPLFINSDTFFSRPGMLSNYLVAYSLTKRHFAELGKACAAKGGIHFVNMRFEHLYGEGDDASKFVMSLIDQCIRGVSEIRLTPGEQQRDFIHVDDAVAAFMTILDQDDALPDFIECEVGSGTSISLREFCMRVHQLSGERGRLMFGALPYMEGEIMASKANVEVLKGFGWSPAVDLDVGLSRLIAEQRGRIQ